MSIIENPLSHAGLRGLLMIEWVMLPVAALKKWLGRAHTEWSDGADKKGDRQHSGLDE